jgi:hypothetical protein
MRNELNDTMNNLSVNDEDLLMEEGLSEETLKSLVNLVNDLLLEIPQEKKNH